MELIGKLKQKAENAAGKEEGGYERLVVKDIVKQI